MNDIFEPNSWIEGYSFDGVDIKIPVQSLKGLTSGDAANDIRKVFYAICSSISDKYDSLEPENKPEKMKCSKISGFVNNSVQQTFVYNFTMASVPLTIDAE